MEGLNEFGKFVFNEKMSDHLLEAIKAQGDVIENALLASMAAYALERWDELNVDWQEEGDGGAFGVPLVEPAPVRHFVEAKVGPVLMASKQLITDTITTFSSILGATESESATALDMASHALDHMWCDALYHMHVSTEVTRRAHEWQKESGVDFEAIEIYLESMTEMVEAEVAPLYDMGCTEDRHGTLADLPHMDY